ncbi:MAG: type I glutamate--ammonia ligase [Gemmatimonadetes bacterium]|nr:type I glutamate--ammonia ligase [Gemmatimonadota bacterium]
MFRTFAEVGRHMADHGVRMVDLKFVDLWGRWRHVTIPAAQFTERVVTEGIGFDGSAVGFRPVAAGDMALVPELATGIMDPFWDVPTLSFICASVEADTHIPNPYDPRIITTRAEHYLRESGVADESRWGPEFEFYVFDSATFENSVNRASYRVESSEAEWSASEGGHAHVIPLHGGYHAIGPTDRLFNLRAEISLFLEQMGVPVKYHHHEVGGPGQVELEIPLAGLVAAADMGMLVKYVCKQTAFRHGQTATFMPKPLYGEAGSGMHFHQHLFRAGRNLFFDPDGYGLLGDVGRWYIGGLLRHAPALLGLTNPSTNSYRRLVPGFEAPVHSFYSLANRSAAVRIPKYATTADTVRIEFRPPDGTCNMYLAMAAQLMAGIDGVLRRIDPSEQGYGPFDEDVFSASPDRLGAIRLLPTSLDDALAALEADHQFLLQGGVFSEGLIERWIRAKREREVKAVAARPHPYEVFLYFDV